MRSSVSIVILLPSRSRCTSLPSLTARRPKVDSAMSAWRQNSEIWLRIWSFFITNDFNGLWDVLVGNGRYPRRPTSFCPLCVTRRMPAALPLPRKSRIVSDEEGDPLGEQQTAPTLASASLRPTLPAPASLAGEGSSGTREPLHPSPLGGSEASEARSRGRSRMK